MRIICTGTPGTGKTTIAKAIAKKCHMQYVEVNKIIKTNNLREGYDKKRQTYIVDEKKLTKILLQYVQKNKSYIIDSHLSHYLPAKKVTLCIVTKTDLKELKKRLEKRKYPKAKIRENIDAEIFDICYQEALEAGHTIQVIDTTKKSLKQCLTELNHVLHQNKR